MWKLVKGSWKPWVLGIPLSLNFQNPPSSIAIRIQSSGLGIRGLVLSCPPYPGAHSVPAASPWSPPGFGRLRSLAGKRSKGPPFTASL